ncbi:glutamate-5-semialdehyde dehydrogenase [Olsenella sp. Marseille-P4559]|uniref:glutamate-5-semialdehyde dehydrogenase n=1 Tax=Olsenella sp. Marseille-P4559 TaxID=2364795 RepID=UPI0010314328|nr:glutamate-5-semialdehyde dehydrogenase [Olsenella sp. Marseille-P4559]
MSEARTKAELAREASHTLGQASAAKRSAAIRAAARLIRERNDAIASANARDMERSRKAGMPAPLLDRLLLDADRLEAISSSLEEMSRQEDPLGRVSWGRTLDSGVRVERISVPMGVVAMIYEARPNVTADAFGLCVRTGNACVLKGGAAARESCMALAACCRDALVDAGLPADAIQYVEDDAEHTQTSELVHATGLVDVLIPRGGASLIRYCVENATVPVIETGIGNCHIYLHGEANAEKAVGIVVNAKCSRPGVCNAAESLLVDACAAERLLPPVLVALDERGVELVGDALACKIAAGCEVPMGKAAEDDWGREYLDLKMSVKCVQDVAEAIAHINRYGTGHSEAIVSDSYDACEAFLAGVDAAVVYANASTRFTDGGVFGLGGEIGISTQKLHARGPMGASALTTTKYVVRGDGQVR